MATISWIKVLIEVTTPLFKVRIGGERLSIPLRLVVAGGVAGITGAGLALWWKSLPAPRRQELLSAGTEAVVAAFNNRTGPREEQLPSD
mgnify:CR=1 FL=1